MSYRLASRILRLLLPDGEHRSALARLRDRDWLRARAQRATRWPCLAALAFLGASGCGRTGLRAEDSRLDSGDQPVLDQPRESGKEDEADDGGDAGDVFALVVRRTSEGTVRSDVGGLACGEVCSATYAPGTVVELSAFATACTSFLGWASDCSGTGRCVLTMDQDHSVTATFSELSGDVLWRTYVSESAADWGLGVDVDSEGNVLWSGAVGVPADPVAWFDPWDVLIANEASSDGVERWSLRFGSSENDLAEDLALDAFGSVFVTGVISGIVDAGGGPIGVDRTATMFLASYRTVDGSPRWSRAFPDAWGGDHVVTDAVGNLVVVGFFGDAVDLGAGTITGPPLQLNSFLAKFRGSRFGSHLVSTPRLERGVRVDIPAARGGR